MAKTQQQQLQDIASGKADKHAASDGESFLTKPVVGSVPSVKWWHALVAAVLAVGGTVAYKKYHK